MDSDSHQIPQTSNPQPQVSSPQPQTPPVSGAAPFGGAPVEPYEAAAGPGAAPPFSPPAPGGGTDGGGGVPVFPGGTSSQPQPAPRRSHGVLFFVLVLLALMIFGVVAVLGLVAYVVKSVDPSAPAAISVGSGKNLVGLLRVEDAIMDNTKIMEVLKYYKKESKIKAVLVRIDSPGGAVGSSQELYAALEDLKKSGKPVVAFMNNVAASGGYYTAAAADCIVSNPGALTGSIGVIFSVPNLQSVGEKLGVRFEVIKSGKFKDTGSMSRTMTDDEKKLLQSVIDDTYNQFLKAILDKRADKIEKAFQKMRKDHPEAAAEFKVEDKSSTSTADACLRQVADGRIFTGRQALEYGLVDKIGSQEDALRQAGDLARVKKAELFEYKPRRGFRELFESEARTALGMANLLPATARLEYRMPF